MVWAYGIAWEPWSMFWNYFQSIIPLPAAKGEATSKFFKCKSRWKIPQGQDAYSNFGLLTLRALIFAFLGFYLRYLPLVKYVWCLNDQEKKTFCLLTWLYSSFACPRVYFQGTTNQKANRGNISVPLRIKKGSILERNHFHLIAELEIFNVFLWLRY